MICIANEAEAKVNRGTEASEAAVQGVIAGTEASAAAVRIEGVAKRVISGIQCPHQVKVAAGVIREAVNEGEVVVGAGSTIDKSESC